ncbi:MAG: hypothetical protein K0S08_1505 [Gammaproteobacteria bacterium]|jgi:hypothetical protein|nr:hypothetical protein [Gammaproteobacteria bacterium]
MVTNYSLLRHLLEVAKTLNISAGVGAFATFVNMFTTIFIYRANREMKIIGAKQLRSDLFKQRYDLFSEMSAFITKNFPSEEKASAEKQDDKPSVLDFMLMAEKAKFLFPDLRIGQYIEEVIHHLYIAYKEDENHKIYKNEDSVNWLKEQIKSGAFADKFKDYLVLPKAS